MKDSDRLVHNIRAAVIASNALKASGNNLSKGQEQRILMAATETKTPKSLQRALKRIGRGQ